MKKTDIKWILKDILTRNDFSIKILRKRLMKGGVLVNKNSHLTLEGYPRSGNTFCVAALLCVTDGNINIARHRHEIGQLKSSLKQGLSTNIVIRSPENSIPSFVIRENVSPAFALNYYINYHNFLLKQIKFFNIICFEDYLNEIEGYTMFLLTISKYSGPVGSFENISERIKEKIIQMELDDSGELEVRSSHISLPSQKKDLEKKEITLYLEEKFKRKMSNANEIYLKLKDLTIKL